MGIFHISKYTLLVLITSLLIIPGRNYGQALVKANCLAPYEIQFSKSNLVKNREFEIQYVDHDDHTFWYKLEVAENGKFSYSFSSLDDQENFDIYFYQYDGNNFCRSFIQNNLELISFAKNVNTKVGKGETYYLGIFALYPGGCGHKIDFTFNEFQCSLTVQNEKKKCVSDEKIANPTSTADKGLLEVRGMVRDKKTGNPINASIKLIDPFTNHEVDCNSNDQNGFTANLYEEGDYKIRIKAFGYEELLSVLPAYESEVYQFEMNWSNLSRYVLNNVYFYPNTYALKEESMPEMESIFSFLVNHPQASIEIIGHTNGTKDVKASRLMDQKGPEWNFSGSANELSKKRSEVIRDFLANKGVDQTRINAIGKGGEEMIVPDPQNMREAMKNIRVEIVVLQ